jgi:hypothetical protein
MSINYIVTYNQNLGPSICLPLKGKGEILLAINFLENKHTTYLLELIG